MVTNLQRGFQQQLVVATAVFDQFGRDRRQFTVHAGDRQLTLGDPAGLAAHARAVAGKQIARDFRLVAAQSADHAEGIQVSGHGVDSPNWETR